MLLYKTTLHQCDRFTYIFHLIRSEVYNAVNVPCRIKKKHWALTSPSKQTPMQILFVSGQCDRDCSNPNFLPTNSLHAQTKQKWLACQEATTFTKTKIFLQFRCQYFKFIKFYGFKFCVMRINAIRIVGTSCIRYVI